MSLLNSNLLKMAARLIPNQSVLWSQYLNATKSSIGILSSNYADPITITASVQPVSRTMYAQLGLDFQKSYIVCYTSTVLQDLERNKACDLIDYFGRRYNVESNTNWVNQNGWVGSLCVDTGPTP